MSLAHAPADMKAQKELVIEAADLGPALEDETVVLAAVAQDGEAFKLAPENWPQDRERRSGEETMQTKKDIVEKAVLSSPKVLQYVPSDLRKVALDAVKNSPEARAQLERSRTMAGIDTWRCQGLESEQEIERMKELADTKRNMKMAEKTQERLQHNIELMRHGPNTVVCNLYEEY
eukprot:Skav229038  [mRNA]  locus=scaffold1014:308716:316571:+ [translate_table: standard]